jgi:hypothetical protein
MKEDKLRGIIEGDSFKKAIKDAIEYGKGTDWGYNGVEEYEFDIFDLDLSLHEVIRVIKEHLL